MSTVLVTSVESLLGRSIARSLSTRGHSVYGVARNQAAAEEVSHDTHRAFSILPFDLFDEAELRSGLHALEEHLAGQGLSAIVQYWPDILTGPLTKLPMHELRKRITEEVFGVLSLARTALPLLRLHDPDPGRLIHVGSLSGLHAFPFFGANAITKHAQQGMMDSLRIEWAPFGIGISSILPGKIRSPVSDQPQADLHLWEDDPDFGPAVRRWIGRYSQSRGADIQTILDAVHHAVESPHPRRAYLIREGMPLDSRLLGLVPREWLDRLFLRLLGGRVE